MAVAKKSATTLLRFLTPLTVRLATVAPKSRFSAFRLRRYAWGSSPGLDSEGPRQVTLWVSSHFFVQFVAAICPHFSPRPR